MQYSTTSEYSLPLTRIPTSRSNAASLKYGLRWSLDNLSGKVAEGVAAGAALGGGARVGEGLVSVMISSGVG